MSYIPSPEPMFFQPLLPENIDNFAIPKGFLEYLDFDEAVGSRKGRLKKERVNVVARLRSCRAGSWDVRIDEDRRHFREGWLKFVRDHGLQIGDFLVFRHLGRFHFYVIVLEPSGCEREYPDDDGGGGGDEPTRRSLAVNAGSSPSAEEVKEAVCQPVAVGPTSPPSTIAIDEEGLHRSDKDGSKRKVVGCESTPAYLSSGNPYFCRKIMKYCLRWPGLLIPNSFARAHGLADRNCDVTLIDEEQRPWKVALRFRENKYQVYLSKGWNKFQTANALKVGDSVVLELIDPGPKPALKFYNVSLIAGDSTD